MKNVYEKFDNLLSHYALSFKQVNLHHVKYCIKIDLLSLYITTNGDQNGPFSEMTNITIKIKFHLNENNHIRNIE